MAKASFSYVDQFSRIRESFPPRIANDSCSCSRIDSSASFGATSAVIPAQKLAEASVIMDMKFSSFGYASLTAFFNDFLG